MAQDGVGADGGALRRWPEAEAAGFGASFPLVLVQDKAPLILPPVDNKDSYFHHETMRSLWTAAARVLRRASRVFCLGYSLPLTRDADQPIPKLVMALLAGDLDERWHVIS